MCTRFSSANCARDLRSRLKSCTTLIPLMCSCRNELMRAIAVRMRRLASRTLLRKIQVTTKIKGSTAKVARASLQFIRSMMKTNTSSRKASLTIALMPEANRSFSASTSVVTRVTSRPTGLRS